MIFQNMKMSLGPDRHFTQTWNANLKGFLNLTCFQKKQKKSFLHGHPVSPSCSQHFLARQIESEGKKWKTPIR